MNERIDAEIAAALDHFGFRAQAWKCLSAIRSPEYRRSAFRIDLDHGGIVKARRLEDEATAARLADIRAKLPSAFAPVLHRHGAVLLEAWIEGEDLAHQPATTTHLAEAAALLACLHATRSALGRALPVAQSTAVEREAAERCRERLAANDRLRPAEADGIGAALERLDPRRALIGLVHTDFCGENMVIDAQGRLQVIDNERMGVGALGLDLARAWYRWRLPRAAWQCFRDHYEANMPHADALRHFAFWALVATLKSAALRLQLNAVHVHVPIERLREMMAELRQDER